MNFPEVAWKWPNLPGNGRICLEMAENGRKGRKLNLCLLDYFDNTLSRIRNNMNETQRTRFPVCTYCGLPHTVANCTSPNVEYLFKELLWLYNYYGEEFLINNLLHLFSVEEIKAMHNSNIKTVIVSRNYQSRNCKIPEHWETTPANKKSVLNMMKQIKHLHTHSHEDWFWSEDENVNDKMNEARIIVDSHGSINCIVSGTNNAFYTGRADRITYYLRLDNELEEHNRNVSIQLIGGEVYYSYNNN